LAGSALGSRLKCCPLWPNRPGVVDWLKQSIKQSMTCDGLTRWADALVLPEWPLIPAR